jgi:hypothetical protein
MENLTGYNSLVDKGVDDRVIIYWILEDEERTCKYESPSTFRVRTYIMELVC